MKIGIDLRFVSDELYSRFAINLTKSLIKNNKNSNFTIYLNNFIEWFEENNIETKIVKIENASIKEQIDFLKILKKDKNSTMLFFNHFKPIFYKWDYTTIIWWLKDIYYMNFSSYFEKYRYLFLMEKNLKNSRKIVCFDQNTKNELIEKFNIKEEKINIINWFFPRKDEEIIQNLDDKIKLNIKAKYLIKNDFFIYSGGDSIEKNYEKLIQVLDRLKKDKIEIDIVFLWNNVWKNINLRNLILEYKMEKNVYFLWSPSEKNKCLLYNEALATIFPSFYEPFPFRLTEPLYFNTKIIASDLKNIRKIFWENIDYFSPISVNSIYENIKKFLENKDNKNSDYSDIKDLYTIEKTTSELIQIIK